MLIRTIFVPWLLMVKFLLSLRLLATKLPYPGEKTIISHLSLMREQSYGPFIAQKKALQCIESEPAALKLSTRLIPELEDLWRKAKQVRLELRRVRGAPNGTNEILRVDAN
eukprot:g25039.t1